MSTETLTTIATRHQSHYERLKAHEVAKFDAFLLTMDKQIRSELSKAPPENIRAMNAQLSLIGVEMLGTMQEYEAVWLESMSELSIYESGFEVRSLENVVEGVSFTLPSDAQITAAVFAAPLGDIGTKYAGSLVKPLIKDFIADQVKSMQNVIRMGYAQGETTQQIIQRIRGTKPAGYKDGQIAHLKRNQEALVRTTLQHASNQARNETWNNNIQVIDRVKWVSALDDKTSSICRALDGQIFPRDKGQRPPAHIRCRSSTVAVLKKELAFLQRGGTRSARDPVTGKVGKAPQSQTYYGWLKGQPVKVQESIIGPKRAKLLRDGGLSAQRFAELQLGKLNDPINLKQMRKMEPIAFEKAGL